MKALSRRTQQQRIKMECEKYMSDHYDEVVYEAIAKNAYYIAEQVEAMILFTLAKQYGFGEKRLNDVHAGFIRLLQLKGIFGDQPKAEDCVKHIGSKYKINFAELKPNLNFMPYQQYIDENRNV